MTSTELRKWWGLDAMVAGVLVALGWILAYMAGPVAASEAPAALWALLIGHLLLLFAFMGLYDKVARGSGWLGFVGFALAIIGDAMILGEVMFTDAQMALAPDLLPLVSNVAITVGALLLGWAAWQQKAFAVWAIGAWSLGAIVIFLAMATTPPEAGAQVGILVVVGALLVGLGVLGAGWELWSAGPAEA